MADGNGGLKRIGLVVTGIHSRAVTVTDYYQGTAVREKTYATLISTRKEEERTCGNDGALGSRCPNYDRAHREAQGLDMEH